MRIVSHPSLMIRISVGASSKMDCVAERETAVSGAGLDQSLDRHHTLGTMST